MRSAIEERRANPYSPPLMETLLCIRHAESTMNADGLWQGQANPPLSEDGREQARALAERLAGESLSMLVASDLRRARETAEIAGRLLGIATRLEPGLRELDVGDWTGLPREEIARRWPEDFARFRAGDLDVRAGGGETRRELRARVVAALRSLQDSCRGERIAVVTHLGVIRTLAPGILITNAEWFRLDMATITGPSSALTGEGGTAP
jgi:broad specificity phosphatase PhoE